jgi:acetate kinase
MIVLALNCGSSSVKVRVFDIDAGAPDEEPPRSLASGRVEGLPSEEARLT